MKTLTSLATSIVSLLVMTTLLMSCDSYHFENPLPADSKNIYEFPKEFRGRWVVDGKDTLVIGKNFYRFSSMEETKIINRLEVNRGKAANGERQGKYLKSLREVVYDSLGNPKDTVANYVIRGNSIYETDGNKLERGFPYSIKADTIYRRDGGQFSVELSRIFFLRQLGESSYVLNIREGETFEVDDHWWKILLLDKMPDGTIVVSDFGKDKLKNGPGLIYAFESDIYYDGKWTKKQMQKFVQDSVFTDHTMKLKESMRIGKK